MRCEPLRGGTGGARCSGTGVLLRSGSWFSGTSWDGAGLKQGVKTLLQSMEFLQVFSLGAILLLFVLSATEFRQCLIF